MVHVVAARAAPNLVDNGGFERVKGNRAAGWTDAWARAAGTARLAIDAEQAAAGERCARIEHRGREDWSFASETPVPIEAGDIIELEAKVKVDGEGTATLCAIDYGKGNRALNWTAGAATTSATRGWRTLKSRLVVAEETRRIVPRMIGYGPATVWIDAFAVRRVGNIAEMRGGKLPEELSVSNAALSVVLLTADGALRVTDRRTGQVWRQRAGRQQLVLAKAGVSGKTINLTWLHVTSGRTLRAGFALDAASPEVLMTLEGGGELPGSIPYPYPFVSDAGTYLVVPMNEGISYPVSDRAINPMRLIAYGGHGICMAFWGVTDGEAGQMAIVETPDDASIRIDRIAGKLAVRPLWESQKGRFGYSRKLRYVFFDKGGHVAMCKRYRAYARHKGLLKTLRRKCAENENVDLLVGAVNVWCWEQNAIPIVKEMQAAGIERILWSNRGAPTRVAAMNKMPGVLTSRYDIYQDLMDPEIVKTRLRRAHGDWTQGGFPEDIMLDRRGKPRSGWKVKGKDGVMYPCAVLCDRQAVDYARKRVGEELKTHPYRSRFIDTTTASSWRECYHSDHPMTRSESRHWKMELLRYMSEEAGLVTGSETGHDASVPFLHYFEGMMSLGPYRVPDAGRATQKIWDEVPERVEKFQVGHRYRLPLWELVYHDCVVAQWYWGDYNNKLPELWDKRDLFNALYGTPPMFMFTPRYWRENRERFVQSYRATCPIARATGYSEMTDHRFLTPNRDVQQTRFANGVTVTVNFGEKAFGMADGYELKGMSQRAEGL